VFVIAHEVMHFLSGHHVRYLQFIKAHALEDNQRHRMISNKAGDYWINDTLVRSKVGEFVEGCLHRPGSADRTYEEIFKELLDEEKEDGGGEGQQSSGNDIGQDIDHTGPLSESEISQIEAERKIAVAEAAQIAKARGKLTGELAKFAEDTVAAKTPWHAILERYMAGMTNYDVSWSKPNRRYAPSVYMPSVARAPSMGTVVLQIDVSGSINAEEIKYYNGHIKRIVEMCHPEVVHLLYTDTSVLRHETFDNPEDLQIEFYSGGGTSMEAGHRYINDKGITPDVFICLTDGYDSYTTAPDFPVVWCCSTTQPIPYGEVVRFEIV
jgi:predicted metal-dependent peptidase